MKSNKEILEDLTKELIRIGSTKQADYDLLKKKGHVYSTTICRRLKLSWTEVITKTGLNMRPLGLLRISFQASIC